MLHRWLKVIFILTAIRAHFTTEVLIAAKSLPMRGFLEIKIVIVVSSMILCCWLVTCTIISMIAVGNRVIVIVRSSSSSSSSSSTCLPRGGPIVGVVV